MSSVGAGAVRSGWLTKKAEKLGRSKKRYFALVPSQGALYYYDKGNDDSGAAPKVISVASLQLPPAIPTPAFRFPPSLHHPIANPMDDIYICNIFWSPKLLGTIEVGRNTALAISQNEVTIFNPERTWK